MHDPAILNAIISGSRAVGAGRNQWMGKCPVHDDKHPSMAITLADDGRILVHCHAGCSQEALIAAMRERGWWSNGKVAQRPRLSRPVKSVAADSANPGDDAHAARQLNKARWLWQRSEPADERYLCSRGIPGPVPPTWRYLAPLKPRAPSGDDCAVRPAA